MEQGTHDVQKPMYISTKDAAQCPEWFELKNNETAEAFNVLVQSEVGMVRGFAFRGLGFRSFGVLGLGFVVRNW